MANLTGLNVGYLSRLERGEREAAPLTKVQIARRLGVAISELFEVAELEVPELSEAQ